MTSGPVGATAERPTHRRRAQSVSSFVLDSLRRTARESSSYLTSLAIHLTVLALLMLWGVSTTTHQRPPHVEFLPALPAGVLDGTGEFLLAPTVPIVVLKPTEGAPTVRPPDPMAELSAMAEVFPQNHRQCKGVPGGAPIQFTPELTLPSSAIAAGNFAAWWIPAVQKYGESVEPGQLPRVGQDYRIHLLLRMPDGQHSLPIEDLSGEIIGTDGYRQPIPNRAWVPTEQGDLVRATDKHSILRARQGVVEVVFKVNAAGVVGIRDKIRIHSKQLDEEQHLILEFKAVSPGAAAGRTE